MLAVQVVQLGVAEVVDGVGEGARDLAAELDGGGGTRVVLRTFLATVVMAEVTGMRIV